MSKACILFTVMSRSDSTTSPRQRFAPRDRIVGIEREVDAAELLGALEQEQRPARAHLLLVDPQASGDEAARHGAQLAGLELARQEEVEIFGATMMQVAHCEGSPAAEDDLGG